MSLPLLILVFLLFHLALYAAWLRRHPFFRSEKGIFVYHLAGWILAVLGFAGWQFAQSGLRSAGLGGVLAGSLHGLYSLSFLELWSLTQGSYSLGILAGFAPGAQVRPESNAPAELAEIGRKKREARQQALSQLGLLNDQFRPTLAGRALAYGLFVLIALTKGRNLNH